MPARLGQRVEEPAAAEAEGEQRAVEVLLVVAARRVLAVHVLGHELFDHLGGGAALERLREELVHAWQLVGREELEDALGAVAVLDGAVDGAVEGAARSVARQVLPVPPPLLRVSPLTHLDVRQVRVVSSRGAERGIHSLALELVQPDQGAELAARGARHRLLLAQLDGDQLIAARLGRP